MNRDLTFESILKRDNNWRLFKEIYRDQLPENTIHDVEKMLNCCNKDCGFATYICPHCGKTKTFPFSCKSKLCSRCGKKHTDIWAHTLSKKLLNCDHRHIILTISDKLWKFFINHPDRQKLLLDSAAKVITEIFSLKQRLTLGIILVLHPFGDDLKSNFHVHALVSCGGLNTKRNQFIDVNFIPYDKLRNKWQYLILTALRDHCAHDEPLLNHTIDWCFKYLKNGFCVFADSIVKGSKRHILRYIARYTRHPPISTRRIIAYNGTSVTFSYESYGRQLTKTIPKFEFILAVLIHTSSKHFKTIRRFGIYARRSANNYQIATSLLNPQNHMPFIKFNWRFNLTSFNNKDPLSCDLCGSEMHLWSITYFDPDGLPKSVPKINPWESFPLNLIGATNEQQQNRQIHMSFV